METPTPRESDVSFEARVLARTGMVLAGMPHRYVVHGETLPGPIFCARGARGPVDGQFVCGVGYPQQDEEGFETFAEFVNVEVVSPYFRGCAEQDACEAEDFANR